MVSKCGSSDFSVGCVPTELRITDRFVGELPSRTILNGWVAWIDSEKWLIYWNASGWSILNMIKPKSLLVRNVQVCSYDEQMGSILKLATRPPCHKGSSCFHLSMAHETNRCWHRRQNTPRLDLEFQKNLLLYLSRIQGPPILKTTIE